MPSMDPLDALPWSSIHSLFSQQARNAPDEACVIQGDADGACSYRDFDNMTNFIANRLYESGLSKGSVLGICSENNVGYLAFALAAWKLGVIVAAIPAASPPHVLEAMVKCTSPNLIVASDTLIAIMRKTSIQPSLLHTFSQIAFHDDTVRPLTLQDLPSFPSEALYAFSDDPEAIAIYFFTSSQFDPAFLKAVPITHRVALGNAYAQHIFIGWDKLHNPVRNKVLAWLPLAHALGLCCDFLCFAISTGGAYILTASGGSHSATAEFLRSAMIKHRPTALNSVPWLFEEWMQNDDHELVVNVQHFRAIFCSGAAVPLNVQKWCIKHRVNMLVGMGMSEAAGPIFLGWVNDGTAARPVITAEVELLPTDAADEEAAKNRGELQLKSRWIFGGYLNKTEEAVYKDKDDFTIFRTGDLFRKDAHGYEYVSRIDDVIQFNTGNKISASQIESLLDQKPSIKKSYVSGSKAKGPSDRLIAHIEASVADSSMSGVWSDIVQVNRILPPYAKLAMRDINILKGQIIPMSAKGGLHRKRAKHDIARVWFEQNQEDHDQEEVNGTNVDVHAEVYDIVLEVLRLEAEFLDKEAALVDLGMRSIDAQRIVKLINARFTLNLPSNACFVHITAKAMSDHVHEQVTGERSQSHMEDDDVARREISSAPAAVGDDDPVVIVGSSIRLPKGIDSPDKFWDALLDGTEFFSDFPADRWDSSFTGIGAGLVNFTKAGWLDAAGVRSFDPTFFNITVPEAMYIRPDQRLALELAWQALEDANIPPSALKGSNTSVFVGCTSENEYTQLLFAQQGWEAYNRYYGLGSASSAIPGRISYLLDLNGPCVAIDTACSSGHAAVHYGAVSILHGESDCAIVGAVSTHSMPGILSFVSNANMASPQGRCATFTKDADGYAPTEGGGFFVLKRKSAALRNGDTIKAIIRSTTLKSDGKSQGLIAPSMSAQIKLHREALMRAHLQPEDIDLVETHGTGTSAGDLAEIQAINEVYRGSRGSKRKPKLMITAGKSVTGHAEWAAGCIGITKALLSLSKEQVSANKHLTLENINPDLELDIVPLHMPIKNEAMQRNERPLRAAISSFGFAGTIGSVIIEQPKQPKQASRVASMAGAAALTISAKSSAALREYLVLWERYLGRVSDSQLHHACFTSNVGREHFKYRWAAMADTGVAFQKLLNVATSSTTKFPDKSRGKVAFVFSGSSQSQGTINKLSSNYLFRRYLKQCDSAFGAISGTSLGLTELEGYTSISPAGGHTRVASLAAQYSTAKMLMSCGVEPAAVVGHDFVGEMVAAVVADALDLDTAMKALLSAPDLCIKVTVDADYSLINYAIQTCGVQESIIVKGESDWFVLEGPKDDIEAVVAELEVYGVTVSEPEEVITEQQSSETKKTPLNMRPPRRTMISTRNAGPFTEPQHGSGGHILQDTSKYLKDHGFTLLIDMGTLHADSLQDLSAAGLAFISGHDDQTGPLRALTKAYEHGATVDWQKFHKESALDTVGIPSYPFQRETYWPSVILSRAGK